MILTTPRGTHNLVGADARAVLDAISSLRVVVEPLGFEPFIASSLAYKELFHNQIGDNRMFEFKDRKDRDLCLVPEITAVARQERRENPHIVPDKIWYAQRCYRYDKPQRGRYREFFQFGVEIFGHIGQGESVETSLMILAKRCLDNLGLAKQDYTWKTGVDRGMGYYTGQGFEFRSNDGLQLVGGGPYPEGYGFALGIDRCLLIQKEKQETK